MERVDLDGHDRVPADRGDARRAEGAAAAARPRRHRPRRGARGASRSATSCSPGCSSARRSRTRPRCCTSSCVVGPTQPRRAYAGPEEPFRSLAPDPLERVPLDALLAAARARARAEAGRGGRTTDHVAPIRASVRDAIETVLALLPERGAVQLPRADDRRHRRSSRSSCASSRSSSCSSRASSTSSRSSTFGELVVRRSHPARRVALDLSLARRVGRARSAPESGASPVSWSPSSRVEEQV